MSKFDLVETLYGEIPYMTHRQAIALRDLILGEDAKDIIEIGFYQGKSSAYIAAILEDIGDGNLTTFDRDHARKHTPNIDTVLSKLGLAHRVTPLFSKRSYTWELQRLISAKDRPQFDFCYFDGGHTWDITGFGVLLIDMLLRPGGIILLDDMDWSMERSPYYQKHTGLLNKFDKDEIAAKPVRLVWETILLHLGYEHVREYKDEHWGVARKPL